MWLGVGLGLFHGDILASTECREIPLRRSEMVQSEFEAQLHELCMVRG